MGALQGGSWLECHCKTSIAFKGGRSLWLPQCSLLISQPPPGPGNQSIWMGFNHFLFDCLYECLMTSRMSPEKNKCHILNVHVSGSLLTMWCIRTHWDFCVCVCELYRMSRCIHFIEFFLRSVRPVSLQAEGWWSVLALCCADFMTFWRPQSKRSKVIVDDVFLVTGFPVHYPL